MSQTEQGLCIADLSPHCSNRMQTVGRNYCLQPGVGQSHSLGQIAPILDHVRNLSFSPFIFVAEVPVSLQRNSAAGEFIKTVAEWGSNQNQMGLSVNQSPSPCSGKGQQIKINLVSGCHR